MLGKLHVSSRRPKSTRRPFFFSRLSIVIFATQKDEGIRTKPAKPTHSTWHTADRGRKGEKEREEERGKVTGPQPVGAFFDNDAQDNRK